MKFILFFLLLFSRVVFAQFGAGFSYGSLGNSFNLGYNVNDAVGLRINFSGSNDTNSFDNRGSYGILIDVYPTLTLSNLRLSGGFYNIDLRSKGKLFQGVGPYLGLGLGRYSDDRFGIYFTGDLGILFARSERISTEGEGIYRIINYLGNEGFKSKPVASIGIAVTF